MIGTQRDPRFAIGMITDWRGQQYELSGIEQCSRRDGRKTLVLTLSVASQKQVIVFCANDPFSLAHRWRRWALRQQRRLPRENPLLEQHSNDGFSVGAPLAQRGSAALRFRSARSPLFPPYGSLAPMAHRVARAYRQTGHSLPRDRDRDPREGGAAAS
jgi:hypothetical protein